LRDRRGHLPFLLTLAPADRKSTPRTGAKVQGFIKQALHVAVQNPGVLPVAFDVNEMRGDMQLRDESMVGRSPGMNSFIGNWTEFEYGAKGWWTSEFYVDSQHTRHDGSLLTGFKFENRFRLLLSEHRINPVLYVEYEHINRADKTLKEVVGFDSK